MTVDQMMNIEQIKEEARRLEGYEAWSEALELYQRAITQLTEAGESDPSLFSRAGDLHLRLQRREAAAECYEAAVDQFTRARNLDSAFAVCQKILRHLPDREQIYLKVARIRAAQGFPEYARQHYLTYAKMRGDQGDRAEAVKVLEELVGVAPGDLETRVFLADRLAAEGRRADALAHLHEGYRRGHASRDRRALEKVRERILAMDPQAAASGLFGPADNAQTVDDIEETQASDRQRYGPVSKLLAALRLRGPRDVPGPESVPTEGRGPLPEWAREPEPPVRREPEPAARREPVSQPPVHPVREAPIAPRPPEAQPSPRVQEELADLRAAVEPAQPPVPAEPVRPRPTEAPAQPKAAAQPELPPADMELADLRAALESVTRRADVEAAQPQATERAAEPIAHDEAPREPSDPTQERPRRSRLEPEYVSGAELPKAARIDQEEAEELAALLAAEPDEVAHHERFVRYASRVGDSALLIDGLLHLAMALRAAGLEWRAKSTLARILSMDPNHTPALEAFNAGAPAADPFIRDRAPSQPAAPTPAAKPVDSGIPETGFVDLAALIFDEPVDTTTRWHVAANEPTKNEDTDFARILSQFKDKVSNHLEHSDARAHYELGSAYREMGLLGEAIGMFQEALRADPNFLPAIEMLGRTFLDKGDLNAAIKALERGLTLRVAVEDDLIGIYYYLGNGYEWIGNREAAKDYYMRVFAMDINFIDVTERLRTLR
jgi:tetratricopeptide (TPR) repeat protein